MKKLATALVTAGLFFGGMGVAVADSWHSLSLTTPGAAFSGKYMWEEPLKKHGGLRLQGFLQDKDPDDGHNVFLRVKIEGHGWGRHDGVQRKDVKVDMTYYDGAVLKTKDVRLQVCRDRGVFRPDNCSTQRILRRR
ncbi:hypothetical protein [Streptomyces sp. NPDC056144]|uniref:hypothetical protein n=1 Tax=unclassified Streptomyces TaxID=2593676 RepID=UPI0035DD8377